MTQHDLNMVGELASALAIDGVLLIVAAVAWVFYVLIKEKDDE